MRENPAGGPTGKKDDSIHPHHNKTMAKGKTPVGCGCLGFAGLVVLGICFGGEEGPDPSTYPTPRYPPSYAVPASAPSAPEQRDWLYIHRTLNVRSQPNRSAAIVRTLQRGDRVRMGPKDANGWAPVYDGDAPSGYAWRESDAVQLGPPPLRAVSPAPRPRGESRVYHIGPRGGCYTYSASGNKRYVDRSYCDLE